jgi:hypothetical protein
MLTVLTQNPPVNQKLPDWGIPNRFRLSSSCSNLQPAADRREGYRVGHARRVGKRHSFVRKARPGQGRLPAYAFKLAGDFTHITAPIQRVKKKTPPSILARRYHDIDEIVPTA